MAAVFRTRLAELRRTRGLTRMDLVRQAEVSYPTVVRYETEELGNIEAAKIHAFMRVLDCSFDDLVRFMAREPSMTQPHNGS